MVCKNHWNISNFEKVPECFSSPHTLTEDPLAGMANWKDGQCQKLTGKSPGKPEKTHYPLLKAALKQLNYLTTHFCLLFSEAKLID